MKLTKLYIHNYKSFYDTTIELDKLNIVVGENNSGKSNLIDVLEFIDIAIHKDIERAIDEKGGYDRIKNYSAVGEEKVIVRATFNTISERDCYTLSLSFSKKYYMVSIFIKDVFVLINKYYYNGY
ncbi:MAG: AAA family ATPase, partial [Epsilonproteobacteria bacterium]|nr:AAA family ATPase [Campylobacterota bacterium]